MKSELSIVVEDNHASGTVIGTTGEIIFNLAALAHYICKDLDIPVDELIALLPKYIERYQDYCVKSDTCIDISALHQQKEDGAL